MCVVFQHSPLRIGAVGTHVVGFLSKGLLRKAKPLVIFPGCGTRIEAIGLMFLGAKKKLGPNFVLNFIHVVWYYIPDNIKVIYY